MDKDTFEMLRIPLSDIQMSVRLTTIVNRYKLKYVYELVQKSPTNLMKYRNFGVKCLTEVQDIVGRFGLYLEMTFDNKELEQLKNGEYDPLV